MAAGGLGGTTRAMRGSGGVGGSGRLQFGNTVGKKTLSHGTGWSSSRGGRKENGAVTGCSARPACCGKNGPPAGKEETGRAKGKPGCLGKPRAGRSRREG